MCQYIPPTPQQREETKLELTKIIADFIVQMTRQGVEINSIILQGPINNLELFWDGMWLASPRGKTVKVIDSRKARDRMDEVIDEIRKHRGREPTIVDATQMQGIINRNT